jgi:hypothetical protein
MASHLTIVSGSSRTPTLEEFERVYYYRPIDSRGQGEFEEKEIEFSGGMDASDPAEEFVWFLFRGRYPNYTYFGPVTEQLMAIAKECGGDMEEFFNRHKGGNVYMTWG